MLLIYVFSVFKDKIMENYLDQMICNILLTYRFREKKETLDYMNYDIKIFKENIKVNIAYLLKINIVLFFFNFLALERYFI